MLSTILIGNNIVNIAASSLATTFYHESIWKHVYRRGYRRYDITGTSVWRDYPEDHCHTEKADDLALTHGRPIYALMTVLTPVIYIVGKLANGILFSPSC